MRGVSSPPARRLDPHKEAPLVGDEFSRSTSPLNWHAVARSRAPQPCYYYSQPTSAPSRALCNSTEERASTGRT